MTRVIFISLLGAIGLVVLPVPAEAALPQLQVAPLRYDQHLELGGIKTGVIDVSNPTGSLLQLALEVQGFRQKNDQGDLEYFTDERLSAAIQPDLKEFVLGPREAVRVKFTIDPNKLGPGGAYGAIFVRTVDKVLAGQVNTSVRVGTLLILDVAGNGTKSGRIEKVSAPWLVYGRPDIPVTVTYANTGSGRQALAFAPELALKAGWFSKSQKAKGAFVFPGRARSGQMSVATGSQLGLVPVAASDLSGGARTMTSWAVMITGFWTWLLPILTAAIGGMIVVLWRRWMKLRLTNLAPEAVKSAIKVKSRKQD